MTRLAALLVCATLTSKAVAGPAAAYFCEKKDGAKSVRVKDAKTWKECKKHGGRWIKAEDAAAPADEAPKSPEAND